MHFYLCAQPAETHLYNCDTSSLPSSAILTSQAGYRCTLVPRLPFPVPRSPFPLPGISNTHARSSKQIDIVVLFCRMLLIPGTGNGEQGTGNGEPGTGVWNKCTAVTRLTIQNGGRMKRNRKVSFYRLFTQMTVRSC